MIRKSMITFALAAMVLVSQASAAFINGEFNATGGSAVRVGQATILLDFIGQQGSTAAPQTGDFATVVVPTTFTIADVANPVVALNPWFSVSGFTFNLGSMTLVSNVGGFTYAGAGTVAAAGFDTTIINYRFSTQPSATGNQGASWSLTASTIPEPGTYALIGSALLGLGILRRRKA